jgi:hypothetical protein
MKGIELLINLKNSRSNAVESKTIRDFGRRDDISALNAFGKLNKLFEEHPELKVANENQAKDYAGYLKLVSRLMTALFFLIGIAGAGVLFYYNGERPINVLPILFYFVFIPVALLCISFLVMIWNRFSSSAAVPTFFAELFKLLVSFTGGFKKNAGDALGIFQRNRALYGETGYYFIRLQFQRNSIAYVLGAISWFVLSIITTDLAFSWSSTLQLSAGNIYTLTEFLAIPWESWLPDATLSHEIIDKTQYFRASNEAIPSGATAQELGVWWSFLMMCMIVYGLAPRLLAGAWFKKKFSGAVKDAAVNSEEGRKLLGLINNPNYTTTPANHPKNFKDFNKVKLSSGSADLNLENCKSVLLWRLKTANVDLSKINNVTDQILETGGLKTTTDDENAMQEVCERLRNAEHYEFVLILTRYWEPPDREFENFIKKLKQNTGTASINIAPVISRKSDLNEVNKEDWESRVIQIGDPNINFISSAHFLYQP